MALPRSEWERIKALCVVPRMVHQSCAAGMRGNPLDPNGPWIPWVQKPGITLNLGRNKAKREARERRKQMLAGLR
jgi:hypothetical protein